VNSIAVVALDIHKKFSKAVAMNDKGEVVSEERVSYEASGEMEEFLGQFEAATDIVMEATFNWPWIADAVEGVGLVPHLAHPPRVREMARGMAKSDRKDAVYLGKLWLAGEIFHGSYLAPPEVRRMRGLFRLRIVLVRMRTALKNAIHGQLHRQGILVKGCSDLFGKKGRLILSSLRMSEAEQWQLEQKLRVLDELSKQIEVLEEALQKDLKHDWRAELLMTLPGVGEITACSLLAEIGEIERFPNSRALAAYAGLLPLDNESAEKDFGKRTGKHCNHFLRTEMLEAVSGAIRSSARMLSLHARVRAKNRDKPAKARVAVARELIELAHLILTRRVRYVEKRPPRPGGNGSRRRNSSESGQPDLFISPPDVR